MRRRLVLAPVAGASAGDWLGFTGIADSQPGGGAIAVDVKQTRPAP